MSDVAVARGRVVLPRGRYTVIRPPTAIAKTNTVAIPPIHVVNVRDLRDSLLTLPELTRFELSGGLTTPRDLPHTPQKGAFSFEFVLPQEGHTKVRASRSHNLATP